MNASEEKTKNQAMAIHGPTSIKDRIKILDERLSGYIPPRETWTPADEALRLPIDLYRVPVDEARAMQLRALKHAFSHHYKLSDFYSKYCDMRGITPDDIKSYDDLEKIPMIPDLTFKSRLSGEDFAYWIANIYTGEPPTVVIESANPTFDDVLNAYNTAGMVVLYSSGTSGVPTVIPMSMRTHLTRQYMDAKLKVTMFDYLAADHTLLLFPRFTDTNLGIGRAFEFHPKLFSDVKYAMDFKISADLSLKAMTDAEPERASSSAEDRQRKIIDIAIKWLERYERTADVVRLEGGPFMFLQIMDTLEQEGKHFKFGERGMLNTGGGWKVSEDKRVSGAEFRKRIEEMLGIPEMRCTDTYALSEMTGIMNTCPEGHYFHLPYTWLKPLVLDKSFMPADYGERGRFAFLDSLNYSFPGFVITGDEVRMLEHCPVCDRLGPVLESEIKRAPSVELRGCAEEVRTVLQQDFSE
ncbi:MAG: LuxE/PaaK family acyltransferase [Halobacteriota archaeon]